MSRVGSSPSSAWRAPTEQAARRLTVPGDLRVGDLVWAYYRGSWTSGRLCRVVPATKHPGSVARADVEIADFTMRMPLVQCIPEAFGTLGGKRQGKAQAIEYAADLWRIAATLYPFSQPA